MTLGMKQHHCKFVALVHVKEFVFSLSLVTMTEKIETLKKER